MKIGLVCPYSFDVPGGVGTHVQGLADWLRTQGHEVLVIAPGTGPARPGEIRLGRSLGFPFNGSTANLAILPSQAEAAARALGAVDIVHVHEPLTPGIAFAAARAASRLVVTHHAHYQSGLFGPLLRPRAAMLGRRTSLAVSDAAAATARAVTGVAPTVIPNAISFPPKATKLQGRIPVILFVGRRDDPRKGYRLFEQVAERMGDEARFVAVGPGERRSRHVAEYGPLDQPALDAWFSISNIVMAPNTHGESFGMVIVEGLAHGCGIVASDLPAFRALAGDDPSFEWFSNGSVESAVQALRRRIARPIEPEAARAVAERFSWDVVGPRIVDQYRFAPIK